MSAIKARYACPDCEGAGPCATCGGTGLVDPARVTVRAGAGAPGETPREHVVNAQQGVRFVRAALDDLRHRPLANPEAWAQAIEGIARDAMAIDNRLALAVAALDRGGR